MARKAGSQSNPSKQEPGSEQSTGLNLANLIQAKYQGPVPPASEFRAYEEALSGAADRILKIAENAADTSSWVRKGELILKFFGVILIFLIALAAILSAAYVLLHGKTWAGLSLLIVPVATAIAAAIRRK